MINKIIKGILGTVITTALVFCFNTQSDAAEKIMEASISKEYKAAKFTLSFENYNNYSASIIAPNGKEYVATYMGDNQMQCVINERIQEGTWKIKVATSSNVSENQAEESISNVSVSIEGSSEKIVDVTKDIKVATAIAGLKVYFKDDAVVAEWTDSTCGDVDIEVTDTHTMQKLDGQTITGQYYEYELAPTVTEIMVYVVPAQSARIEGAGIRMTYAVDNHPDAVLKYEDISITNKDSISVNAVLGQEYSLVAYRNGEEVLKTEKLKAGTHDIKLPTEIGDNNFRIYVVDDNGNMRSTEGFVFKDVIAPVLQLVTSYENITTQDQSYVIEGMVDDYDFFTINDKEVKVEGDKTFKYEYELKEGLNKIEILAGDKAGNKTEYQATITRIIPEEKPVPWLKIILICSIVGLAGVYLVGLLRRKEQEVSEDKKPEKKKKNLLKKRTKGNTLIYELLSILIPVGALYVVLNYVIAVSVIQSPSMEPTLMTGNTVFYNRLAYVEHPIERGDIVQFWCTEKNEYYSKRVIGLPGDEIRFSDGYVVLNGEYLDESAYIGEDTETNGYGTFQVPEGCYFMLGDNREVSGDSRFFLNPYISKDCIMGKYIGQINFSFQFDVFRGKAK